MRAQTHDLLSGIDPEVPTLGEMADGSLSFLHIEDKQSALFSRAYETAKKSWDDKQFQAVIDNFSIAISAGEHLESKNEAQLRQLALAYAYRGKAKRFFYQFTEALADYSKALNLDPNCLFARSARGSVYIMLDDYPEAEKTFRELLEQNSADAFAWQSHGIALKQQGKFSEAHQSLSQAKRLLNSSNKLIPAFLTTLLAEVNFALAPTKALKIAAIQPIQDILTAEPNNHYALTQRAYACYQLGRNAAARKDFEAVLTIIPNDHFMLLTLAKVYCLLEQYDKARALLRQLLELDRPLPSSKQAAQAILAMLNCADTEIDTNRLHEAVMPADFESQQQHRSHQADYSTTTSSSSSTSITTSMPTASTVTATASPSNLGTNNTSTSAMTFFAPSEMQTEKPAIQAKESVRKKVPKRPQTPNSDDEHLPSSSEKEPARKRHCTR